MSSGVTTTTPISGEMSGGALPIGGEEGGGGGAGRGSLAGSGCVLDTSSKEGSLFTSVILPNSRSNQNKNQIKPKIWRGSVIG